MVRYGAKVVLAGSSLQLTVAGKVEICMLSQLVFGKRNLASMVDAEKLLKLGMLTVTVTEVLCASCFEMVRFPGIGSAGAAESGTEVVNIFCVGPTAFVSVTEHPRVFPASEISMSRVKLRRSEVAIICSVNKVPAESVAPHIL